MKAFKYKLKPSPCQARSFQDILDLCRELYNAGLQERRDAWEKAKLSVGFSKQAAQLPEIKAVREDLAEVNAQVLQDVLRRLSKAFDNFFRRVSARQTPGYPRFKGKRGFKSFTYPQAKGSFRIVGNKLWLSKIGKVKMFLSRPLEGTPKTCTIKREVDGWYAIIVCDEVAQRPLPATGQSVGGDLGIENFLALSNGEMIDNPRHLKRAEKRLKRAQRAKDRKKKRSANRQAAAILLARQHQKIQRQRLDFHHKVALRLVEEFDGLVFEDLNIAGMMKNHHLAKAIADVGWYQFIEIVTSKAANAGRTIELVNPRYTSQECSGCGNRVRKTLSEREHRCIECGLVVHRDTNAAIVIKGRAVPVGRDDGAPTIHEPIRPRPESPPIPRLRG